VEKEGGREGGGREILGVRGEGGGEGKIVGREARGRGVSGSFLEGMGWKMRKEGMGGWGES